MSLRAEIDVTLGDLHLHVAIAAERGDVVAVLGPNAAGKSTLLRALAGLVPLDAGHIELDGRVLDDVPPESRSIALVFQDSLLFPHLNVRDNVAYGVRKDGRAIADQLLADHGLSDLAGRPVHELSGGQAQRVALLRALATRPALLLLDEPLAALDAQTRAAVRRDLREALARFDGVRILVTHDPVDAFALADRIVILEHGEVTDDATPADVAARPRTDYAAELVGTNLVRGSASGDVVTTDAGAALVTATDAEGPVLAVIAPSAVSLHAHRPDGSPRNVWEGRVTQLDPRVGRVHVHVDAPVPLVADVTPAAVTALSLTPGATVWMAVKATEIAVHPV